jgi:hypothetical protein
MATDKTQLEELSQRFKRFAEFECHNSSPLYEKLSLGISKDQELLKLSSRSLHGPVPNLFLAAVHYLLLKGNDHTLSGFYPDIESEHDQDHDPYPHFRAFCLENSGAIDDILRTRLVQTNEVQRSALLLPAFQFLASQTKRPLALVEIGTSAGLNLLWDRYAYDYGNGRICGDKNSEVKLECELRGELPPTLSHKLPETKFRVGLDLSPLNVNNEDDMLWLKALVWPEHKKRMALLESAVRIAQKHPLRLLKGDALEVLPDVLQTSPTDCTVCIVSTFTLNQFSKESHEKLGLLLTEAPKKELYFVYAEYVEYSPGAYPELHAVLRRGIQREDKRLAKCEPHGEWLEWLYL